MEIASVKKNRLKMKSKDNAVSTNKDEAQIQIRFVTKQQQYAVPDYPLSVHSSIIPEELNTLINELLRESNAIRRQVEFDFLICSQFLRSSLLEHIADREVSTEEVIDVEYVEKYYPPEPQDCLVHDDWVSAVAVCGKWILTGCYDNMLHIWKLTGSHQLVIPGHKSPIRAVAWITVNDDNASFVSASMDQTCMIWSWDIAKNSVECVQVCKGHRGSIETVGVNYDKTLMATGAWDNMLYIWSTSKREENDGESASKKARLEYVNETKAPKCAMKGHKQAISGVVWSDKTEIITGSWDHTIKIWDAELNGIKQEIHGDKSFFDIDYSPLSRVVLAGSADQHVRLYDPRSTEGAIVKARFTSHTQWVVSVRWSTESEHIFISGAYDNIVKLWDTRSPKAPLFDLLGHEDKVLCCDWSNRELIMSGGADNTLRIFKNWI
ncbi:PREDICTED: ribosome biogenesis protein WDR12 homolog [Wasmannia auropunctata]|uniref:ribosome biogenesis protein WDR12 homolog n=1 Tax=Wasmannia auropunctata TaxID=64793 RepID=UPI0005EEA02A|nr:PREDICTED: ribosome biogenesis protein WDR12 homolog [Wasmannia auropunctata]